MQIQVNTANNIPLSSAHRAQVEASVAEALAAVEHNIIGVTAFISNESQPQDGNVVTCRMVAEVPAGPAIITEDSAPSLDLAAHAAATDLVARIRRYWDRRNTKDRHASGGLVPAPAPDTIDAAEIVANLS